MRIDSYRPASPAYDPCDRKPVQEFFAAPATGSGALSYDIFDYGQAVYVVRTGRRTNDDKDRTYVVKFASHGQSYFMGERAEEVAADLVKKFPAPKTKAAA